MNEATVLKAERLLRAKYALDDLVFDRAIRFQIGADVGPGSRRADEAYFSLGAHSAQALVDVIKSHLDEELRRLGVD